MDLVLAGTTALVTGGSRGIGKAIARAFLDEGASVAICARGEAALLAARDELGPDRVQALVADIGSIEGVEGLVAQARERLGPIDTVVANATAAAEGSSEHDYSDSFGVDLMQAVRLTEAIRLGQSGHAFSVVCIGSIEAMTASSPYHAYSVMKAALGVWARNAAVALGPSGIRVNAVCPGAVMFEGGWWDQVRLDDPAAFDAHVARMPGGRMGRPEEIADVVVFLASARASWVSGASVVVDGAEHGTIP